MWISTIPYEEAEGELRAHYDRQARALGEPTEMTLAGSLHPALVAAASTCTRPPRNAVGAHAPSAQPDQLRDLSHQWHRALHEPGHDQTAPDRPRHEAIAKLAADPDCFESLGLEPADAAVVRYAVKLTRSPGSVH